MNYVDGDKKKTMERLYKRDNDIIIIIVTIKSVSL